MSNSESVFPLRLADGVGRDLVFAAIPLVLALVASIAWPGVLTFILAGLLILVFALLLHFFRDPVRTSPAGESLILAPADGQVMDVQRMHESHFIQGEALKISTFMSLFDVHVNRAPVEGQVTLVTHVPGKFLQAYRPESSEVNEHNLIGLDSPNGRVLVKQISGIMARRIVCWVRPGRELQAGERLGLIKFGSRVDLFLPPGAEPAVQVGDKVEAGVTIIAHW